MTHNIIGTEAGGRRPPAYLTEIRAGRRRASPMWMYLAAPPVGVALFAIDGMIGFPVCVVCVIGAAAAVMFWPERR